MSGTRCSADQSSARPPCSCREPAGTWVEIAIRWSTVAAVVAVALIAGWVSYDHALAVVREYGESGLVARIYPGTIDGLVYSASMVLLDAARRKVPAPPLARWLLAAGIGATIAVNVAAGAAYGPLGAAVAAWPALALVGSYELLMWLVRTAGVTTAEGSAPRAAVASAGANAAPALPALAVPVPEPARTPAAEAGAPRQSPARSPRRRPRQAARQGHALRTRRSAEEWDAAALAFLATEPQMSIAALARRLETSERTAGRIKARLTSPASHEQTLVRG